MVSHFTTPSREEGEKEKRMEKVGKWEGTKQERKQESERRRKKKVRTEANDHKRGRA